MIRGKRLRPLAVVGDRPLELDGYGTIEPLTKSLPQFKEPANYFGIFIPKSVPPEVIATVEKIWAEQIMNSRGAEEVRDEKGAQFAPSYGADAAKAVMPAVQVNAWHGVRRRQGEGLARHGRHREAVSGRRRTWLAARVERARSRRRAAAPPGSRHRRRAGWRSASRSRSARGAWTGSRARACHGSRRPGSCRASSAC